MNAQQPDITSVTALLGEPARATILLALLSGEALPASELARRCRLTPQTISSHLAKLTQGTLVSVSPQGRHRYYRLARPEIAEMLEAIQRVAPRQPVRSLRQSDETKALCHARTCYDHLAGKLGVAVTRSLLDRELLRPEGRAFTLTDRGKAWCDELGFDWPAAARRHRAFATACLDWSERRDHVGGAFGALIASECFARGWIRRTGRSRAVAVTPAGRDSLAQAFGFAHDALSWPGVEE
jgi:DNA-binding transcriptional ArsR family regulator